MMALSQITGTDQENYHFKYFNLFFSPTPNESLQFQPLKRKMNEEIAEDGESKKVKYFAGPGISHEQGHGHSHDHGAPSHGHSHDHGAASHGHHHQEEHGHSHDHGLPGHAHHHYYISIYIQL